MKTPGFIFMLWGVVLMTSCNSRSGENRFLNLSTGETVELKQDPETGMMVDAETGAPVEIYVDPQKRDTIYGPTGEVINGRLTQDEEGRYAFMGREEEKVSMKENEGSHAARSSSTNKYSVGEYKVKRGNYKYKREVEKDGDITIKDGNKKIKIDGETGKRKVKYDD